MRNLRIWIPSILLAAVTAAGCFLITGQFQIVFEFDDPVTITSPTVLEGMAIDLNSESDYADHRDEIKDVADLALLGKFTNLTATATTVEVWMVASPGGSLLTTDAAVRAAGTKIWGPFSLGASATRQIDWTASSALFVGRAALISEIKGDGRFDLYALGSGTYSFRINNGALVAVISAGGGG